MGKRRPFGPGGSDPIVRHARLPCPTRTGDIACRYFPSADSSRLIHSDFLWTLGTKSWRGFNIDPLSVVLPMLMFVSGFTGSLCLVEHPKRLRVRSRALWSSLLTAITSLTRSAGFGSLMLAR